MEVGLLSCRPAILPLLCEFVFRLAYLFRFQAMFSPVRLCPTVRDPERSLSGSALEGVLYLSNPLHNRDGESRT